MLQVWNQVDLPLLVIHHQTSIFLFGKMELDYHNDENEGVHSFHEC